ncbi:hypothetical protein RvY_06502 [Ramazzottius varieornatus]|uniref:Uncharacterized protein n=1 Tax=Ramazzottius varieornatus TaxID=947166 RepID=A0A1D1V290_RAMVA|nr:hypothetical protein RvY_06502 [Ramazzottius varieornatus]
MDGCLVDQRFVWRGIPGIHFVLLTDDCLPFVDSRPLLVGNSSCFLGSSLASTGPNSTLFHLVY